MITSYPVQDPFSFLGNHYENLEQFRNQLITIDSNLDPDYWIVKDKTGHLLLVRFELYPCFDSSDWIYEDRFYRYIFYCKTKEELDQKYSLLKRLTFLSSSAQDQPELIPNLFYGEDTLFFEIADGTETTDNDNNRI